VREIERGDFRHVMVTFFSREGFKQVEVVRRDDRSER
jgi:hypothetical protein